MDVVGSDSLRGWIELARERVPLQGLPARICWLGLGERDRVALALNELVRTGECGPLALGRDHMDPASVASPSRETEGMLDGSDAIADWPVLSALLKYVSTDRMRQSVNDALDIHGGRGICDGPSNYIQGAYQMVPVGITVEGANILTRTLITFAPRSKRYRTRTASAGSRFSSGRSTATSPSPPRTRLARCSTI